MPKTPLAIAGYTSIRDLASERYFDDGLGVRRWIRSIELFPRPSWQIGSAPRLDARLVVHDNPEFDPQSDSMDVEWTYEFLFFGIVELAYTSTKGALIEPLSGSLLQGESTPALALLEAAPGLRIVSRELFRRFCPPGSLQPSLRHLPWREIDSHFGPSPEPY